MSRVKRGVMTRKRHNKIIRQAKGFRMAHSTLFRQAKEAVQHAMQYAYRDRRNKKRDFRRLWITRISAACRNNGITYSVFMDKVNKSGIDIDRKMLAEMAVNDAAAFTKLVQQVSAAA